MTYQEILSKDGARILITGDSLAYNRYSYDRTPRENAFDCGVGMGSWSFALRDRILTSDPYFVYGDELQFSCKAVRGIDHLLEIPYTAMFEGRVQTLHPIGAVSFCVSVQNNQVVLYLQRRADSECTFDIYMDGNIAASDVCTKGDPKEFAGYGLYPVVLPCSKNRSEHYITLANIRGNAPKITIAGAGSKHIDFFLSGKGNQCTRYFVENFEERIGKYAPELVLLSLTANDRGRISAQEMQADLQELFTILFSRFPKCKVLFLLPPSAHNPAEPDSCVSPYTSLIVAETYCCTAEKVCRDFSRKGFDLETLCIASLFADMDVSAWRYDNIHMNQRGNSILLEAVADRLGIMKQGGKHYGNG